MMGWRKVKESNPRPYLGACTVFETVCRPTQRHLPGGLVEGAGFEPARPYLGVLRFSKPLHCHSANLPEG
jgi:hypothetical protein